MKFQTLDDGLAALHRSNDFAVLKSLIIEILAGTKPVQAKIIKDRIARIMRAKQITEAQNAVGHSQALDAIDRKYSELAKVLKHAPVGVVSSPQIIPPSPNLGNTQAPPASAPAPAPAAQPESTPQPQLARPAMPMGAMGAVTLVNWLRSKKSLLMKGAGVTALLGGAYWMYNRATNPIPVKNPNDKESDFSRTIRSIEKYRAFSRMSKDPNFSGDYSAFLEGKLPVKPKKNPPSTEKSPDHKKSQWDRDEQKLMGYMDNAHAALTERPKMEIPRLPFNRSQSQESPIPIISDEVESVTHSEATRQKKKKKNPVVEGISEPKGPVTKSEEPTGRLIPIIKRTKRIRKVA